MAQIIYSVGALFLVVIFSLTMYTQVRTTEQRMYLNEANSQLTGIAYDIHEDLNRRGIAFDYVVDEQRIPEDMLDFPIVTSAGGLTSPTDATRWGICNDYQYEACNGDIDNFDGLTDTLTVAGLKYRFEINVQYVSDGNPDTPTGGSPSFSKEVAVRVFSPTIVVGDDTLSVTLKRVISYDRNTTPGT